MNYQFEYKWTIDDYFEFNKYHIETSQAMKKQIKQTTFLPMLMVVIVGLGWLFFNNSIFPLIFGGIVAIVWFFVAKKFLLYTMKKHIKSMEKDGKITPNQPTLLQFHNDFFTSTADGIETTIKYPNIEKIGICENAIYIFITAVQAIIMPIHIFESDTQRSEFLDFINQKME